MPNEEAKKPLEKSDVPSLLAMVANGLTAPAAPDLWPRELMPSDSGLLDNPTFKST